MKLYILYRQAKPNWYCITNDLPMAERLKAARPDMVVMPWEPVEGSERGSYITLSPDGIEILGDEVGG